MIIPRTLVSAAFVVVVALAVNACGKKSLPDFPPDSDYPRSYPAQGSPAPEEQKPTKP